MIEPNWSKAKNSSSTQANKPAEIFLENYWITDSIDQRSSSFSNELPNLHPNKTSTQDHTLDHKINDRLRYLDYFQNSSYNSNENRNNNLSQTFLNERPNTLIEKRRPIENLVCLPDTNKLIHNKIVKTSSTSNQKIKRPTSLNLVLSQNSTPASYTKQFPFSKEENYCNLNSNSNFKNRQSQSARSSFRECDRIKQSSVLDQDQFSNQSSKFFETTASASLELNRYAVTAENLNAHLINQSKNELVERIDNFNNKQNGLSAPNSIAVAVNHSQSNHTTGTQSTIQQSHNPTLTSQASSTKSNTQIVHSTDEEINSKQNIKEKTTSSIHQQNRSKKHRSSEGNIINTNNSLEQSDQGDIELAYLIKSGDKYRDCTTTSNGIVFRDRGSIHRNNSRKLTTGTAGIDNKSTSLGLITTDQQQINKQHTNRSGLVSNNSNILPTSSSGYSSASRLYKTNLDNELPSRSIDASAEDSLLDDEELGRC